MQQNYKLGQTKVIVHQLNERGQAGIIQCGIVVGETSSFLRVYNPNSIEKGGDPSPQMAQWFAIQSPRCYVEIVGELKDKIKLPADL